MCLYIYCCLDGGRHLFVVGHLACSSDPKSYISEIFWMGKGKCNFQRVKPSFTPEDMMTTIKRELAYCCQNMQQDLWWNALLIQARFYFKYIKLRIIHIYIQYICTHYDTNEQIKDEFFGRLQDVLDSVNEHDMLNVKVGNDNLVYESVMGKHGLGKEMIEKGFAICVIRKN